MSIGHDTHAALRLNGYPCKKPENTMANDFYSDVLSILGKTGFNAFGPVGTAANVEKVPGLNTLGVTTALIDQVPVGMNPPHTHPRAPKIIFVLEGGHDVKFVTTADRHFARIICRGKMFRARLSIDARQIGFKKPEAIHIGPAS